MYAVGHWKLFHAHGPEITFRNGRVSVRFQERTSKGSDLIKDAQVTLSAVLFLDLRIDKAVFCEHQPPFSGMASGAVFAVLILDNSLLIQKIHKADFIFPSV